MEQLLIDVLRSARVELVRQIDVDHGLWTHLQSRNVLTREHIDDCRSCVCHYCLLCSNYNISGCNIIAYSQDPYTDFHDQYVK